MQLSQIAVQYSPEADRLLLRVRSTSGQLYEAWLTRRLVMRFWPHVRTAVEHLGAKAAAARVAPGAVVMPEAQPMLAQVAKESVLREADFKTPFNAQATSQPLGKEPMLATEVQMTTLPDGQLHLTLFDAQRRSIALQLTDQMAIAVRELLEQGLGQAQWGLLVGEAGGARVMQAVGERVLN
jgi:hypothetical protein